MRPLLMCLVPSGNAWKVELNGPVSFIQSHQWLNLYQWNSAALDGNNKETFPLYDRKLDIILAYLPKLNNA